MLLLLIDNQTEELLLRKVMPCMMLACVSKVNECGKHKSSSFRDSLNDSKISLEPIGLAVLNNLQIHRLTRDLLYKG